MKRRDILIVAGAGAGASLIQCIAGLASAVAAEPFPDRSLRLVVPWAPGGIIDTLARLAANRMEGPLKQQIVVDNRPGANGQIGYRSVLQARPDGYTILTINSGATVLPVALGTSLPFDPINDFTPVVQIADYPLVLIARKNLPANTVQEMLALSRTRKGGLNISVSALGAISHLTSERLIAESGVPLTVVSYKSEAPLITAVAAGDVELGMATNPMQAVRDGQVKALAVTGATRWSMLPDVPTLIESGFPGFVATGWCGFAVPAKTPAPIVDALVRAARSSLETDEVRATLRARGVDPVSRSPVQFAELINKQVTEYRALVKSRNISLEPG